MSQQFLAGSGRVEITPPAGVPALGFRPRHLPLRGVHDPLYARAVVVSAGGDEPAAIIAADSIGFYDPILSEGTSFMAEVRARIRERTGIREERIMLASTHAHSTPETIGFRPLAAFPEALEWLGSLPERLAEAVASAAGSMKEAQLKTAAGSVAGVSVNRRKGQHLDTDMTALLFASADGKEDILLVQYACHPVILQVQEQISADFVGSMIEGILGALPTVKECLFLQGACADINPVCGDSRKFADVYWLGRTLAGEAIKLYGTMKAPSFPDQPAIVQVYSGSVPLKSRPIPNASETEQLERDIADLKARLAVCQGPEEAALLNELGPKEEIMWRVRRHEEEYKAEVQAIVLGRAVLLGIPGEPFCEMGLAVKQMFRPLTGIPVGFANNYLGYIAPSAAWAEGGYEVRLGPWSKVGPEGYDRLLQEFQALSLAVCGSFPAQI